MPLPRSFHVRRLLRLRSFSTAAEAQTQKLECIADELLSLNRLEHYDFNILFRLKLGLDRWGAAGPPAAGLSASAAPAAVASEAAADKTAFDVKLEKFDAAAKLKVIKEVRSFTDLGLKEAKTLVEKAPVVLKKAIPKEDAEKIAAKLKEIGATISLE